MRENHVWNIACRFYYFAFEFLHGRWYLYPRLSLRGYAYLYITQIQTRTVKTEFCILICISSHSKINILSKYYYRGSTIKGVELQIAREQSAISSQLCRQCAPPLTSFCQGNIFPQGFLLPKHLKVFHRHEVSRCSAPPYLTLLFVKRRTKELYK